VLKEAKEKLGYSYQVLGNMLGVDKGTAFSWINNPARASKNIMRRVAEVLELDEDEVIQHWKELRIKRYTERL